MPTIYEYLARHGGFQAFLASAKICGFNRVLEEEGHLTLFVPTDEAFARLSPCLFDALLSHPEELLELEAFHAMPEILLSEDISLLKGQGILAGKWFSYYHNSFFVNGAAILETDIRCVNGIVHVIDRVLMPSKKKIYV